ncbi:RES domain-containing protein (plasmid) [Paracoccus denitrificans]|uniref:RES family NAD+ phosphorylase n=1 Tax=Paracoccus denitrificans TaxID=266 RepID=UPI001E3066C2|nr:RES domain-containing protein [Paracoccus denitrificans]UFS68224.1 RES domain-containing protein [Paracoccus denitrificans]
MHYRGLLYRALNPIWAREPLSGEGARRFGGRFNPKGTPTLYTSLSIMAAIREANQIGTLQPTTLVAYRADLEPVFDATDASNLHRYGLAPADLAANDWRIRMQENRKAPTQILAEQLVAAGYAGMLARSFVNGATEEDRNLVLWTWGDALSCLISVVDDEGRLS